MAKQKYFLSPVALHMSLATIKGTLSSSCKMPDIFKKIWIFSTDFNKSPSVKFRGNPSYGSRAVTCEQMDRKTDRRA
jgi:hypothetical protein